MEVGNKLTLLGFYGVAPDIGMVLNEDEWNKPMPMMFVLAARDAIGEFNALIRLFNPDGSLMAESDPIEIDMETGIGFVFAESIVLTFTQSGKHRIQCLINDKQVYNSTFQVH
jgi:hypothetical protein